MMRRYSTLLLVILSCFALVGCATSPGKQHGGYLSKKQVLKMDPGADVLVYDEKVYKTDVDWIAEVKLTKNKQLGHISNGMATHIPLGATIFSTSERGDILIVEYKGIEKRYVVQIGE